MHTRRVLRFTWRHKLQSTVDDHRCMNNVTAKRDSNDPQCLAHIQYGVPSKSQPRRFGIMAKTID